MELNNDLITQFAKITKFNTGKSATTVRGTIRKADDESDTRTYLQIDGAEEGSKTPVDTVVEVADGDRVIATVKDHSVIVTGNKTNPSIGKKTADGLRSEIIQETNLIRAEVADDVADIHASIELTAGEIRTEVADEVRGLNSTISQTSEAIRSEIDSEVAGLTSTIEQTAGAINQRIDNLGAIDGEEFTEFKQTVEGFYFTDENGTVYIDGGSVYAKNLNLTGAITWGDLDDTTKDNIDGAASDAASSAISGLEDDIEDIGQLASDAKYNADTALQLFMNMKIPELPDYIEETYIDKARIESPTIIGGYIYAVGSDPDDGTSKSFTAMDENGFYLYHDSDIPDNDGGIYPKISLRTNASGSKIQCILGSGAADDSETYNRFYIEKSTSYVSLRYVNDYDGNYVGLDLFRDGEIMINAKTISGYGGVFPIGYIYISTDTTSPASLFGGSWSRLSGYFLYATGSDSKVDTTVSGGVVTAGGTNSAAYINIAAWERVG